MRRCGCVPRSCGSKHKALRWVFRGPRGRIARRITTYKMVCKWVYIYCNPVLLCFIWDKMRMAIVGSPMYRSDNPRNWDQSVMGWTIAMGWSYFPQSRHWSSKKLLISCFQWSNHGYFSVNLLCLVLKYKNQETRHQCVCYLPRWVAWTCLYKTLLMHQVDSGWVAARHSKTTSLVSKWSTNLGNGWGSYAKGRGTEE